MGNVGEGKRADWCPGYGLGRVPTRMPLQVQASRCTTEWDRERRAQSRTGGRGGWAAAGSPRPHDETSLALLHLDPVSIKDTLDEVQGPADPAGPCPGGGMRSRDTGQQVEAELGVPCLSSGNKGAPPSPPHWAPLRPADPHHALHGNLVTGEGPRMWRWVTRVLALLPAASHTAPVGLSCPAHRAECLWGSPRPRPGVQPRKRLQREGGCCRQPSALISSYERQGQELAGVWFRLVFQT